MNNFASIFATLNKSVLTETTTVHTEVLPCMQKIHTFPFSSESLIFSENCAHKACFQVTKCLYTLWNVYKVKYNHNPRSNILY